MYREYKIARDAAWKALIACSVKSLPLDLTLIAAHYQIGIITYSECPFTPLFRPEIVSGDGFITPIDGKKTIFLNDKIKTRGRRRFTTGMNWDMVS